ncbi:MAG TPA: metallophosphoesterase [Opitutaceae bacterium]|nr:metallophosphoesterase [Opitutaceae bacterium]
MPAITRIFSDVHYGDRASRVVRLAQLRPLLDHVDGLILNGDTLDTRTGPKPARTAALRAEALDFFAREVPAVTLLTGNHDADISPHHFLDLADGRVVALHGDVLFDSIVPWGHDAPLVARLIAAELATLPPDTLHRLDQRFAVWRRIAGRIPQRHQSETHGLKYYVRLALDVGWPPLRALQVLRAWREEPRRAGEFLRRHRPAAKVLLVGHTHRPAILRPPGTSAVVVNTGSFCPPLGGFAADVSASQVVVRRVVRRRDEFRLGETIAEIPLADR